jgi:hypothetical protein
MLHGEVVGLRPFRELLECGSELLHGPGELLAGGEPRQLEPAVEYGLDLRLDELLQYTRPVEREDAE